MPNISVIPYFSSNYDIVFCAIIIISSCIALFRGGVSEIFSSLTWIFAVLWLHKFAKYFDPLIPQYISSKLARIMIDFVVFFVCVAIIMVIIKKMLLLIFESLGIGSVDSLLGILFGIIRGVLICAILIIVIKIFRLDPSDSWQKAKTFRYIRPVVAYIVDAMPRELKNR